MKFLDQLYRTDCCDGNIAGRVADGSASPSTALLYNPTRNYGFDDWYTNRPPRGALFSVLRSTKIESIRFHRCSTEKRSAWPSHAGSAKEGA